MDMVAILYMYGRRWSNTHTYITCCQYGHDSYMYGRRWSNTHTYITCKYGHGRKTGHVYMVYGRRWSNTHIHNMLAIWT